MAERAQIEAWQKMPEDDLLRAIDVWE